jgi:hypothetical protein
MEQEPPLFQDHAGGMDNVVGDEWTALKKRGVVRGHAQVIWLSILHV